MSNWKLRLHEEYNQLNDRIDKLKEFILGERYDELPEIERIALKQQLQHMQNYATTLSHRLSRLCT